MTTPQIISIAVFVGVMALIASDKMHRTLAALIGAVILLFSGILPFADAMNAIDFNTLAVLTGMMMFVGVIKESGLFEYLAIKSAKIAKGDPWRVMIALILVTAVLSAFLDNVTTVLLVAPMTFTICKLLDVNPIPYFITQMIASNVGGTATLIGDPPNIMIGSAAGFSFFDFVEFETPCIIVVTIALLILFRFMYGKKMSVLDENRQKVMAMDEKDCILDAKLFRRGVIMIFVVIFGFLIHGKLGLEPGIIALAAAAIMILISGQNIEKVITTIEWPTIGFFTGLFIVVGGLSATGVITMLANWMMDVTSGNFLFAMMLILWVSAILSAIIDNIPFVATMIPVLLAMGAAGMDIVPLWWALSLGACLGGIGTQIGASANVVLSGISSREGYPITFMDYLKVGFPVMLLCVGIATVYLLIVF